MYHFIRLCQSLLGIFNLRISIAQVLFPSILLGTREKWILMKTISVTEYLNYEARKFSKTKGVGVFGNDAKSINISVETW